MSEKGSDKVPFCIIVKCYRPTKPLEEQKSGPCGE
jgi:hypothetical protein